ncbi:MAG: CHRD domain-containing protein [Ottowia sp.]|uniref:CHRD domain-containing protein n=1 Tax=Ottowia sp. TaxID=1898956 RepID=UPI003C73CC9D
MSLQPSCSARTSSDARTSGFVCKTRQASRLASGLMLAALLAACGTQPTGRPAPPAPTAPPAAPQREPELAAFRAQLNGRNVVPRSDSAAQGQLVAVLNRTTGLFRWKLTFDGMSGPVRTANFYGPAMDGEVANPRVALGKGAVTSPNEGSAMLTPSQKADVLMGQWYVNLSTARYPDGEIRGQLIEQR